MPVRRVRRVIRKIDPWTVLKVSFVINLIGALIFVLGTWVSWSLIIQAGIPEKISDIAGSLTINYEANGEQYFRVIVLLAGIGAIVLTGVFTLGAVLYNLISDLVGGVEVVVLEESTVVPQAALNAAMLRQATAAAATAEVPAAEQPPKVRKASASAKVPSRSAT